MNPKVPRCYGSRHTRDDAIRSDAGSGRWRHFQFRADQRQPHRLQQAGQHGHHGNLESHHRQDQSRQAKQPSDLILHTGDVSWRREASGRCRCRPGGAAAVAVAGARFRSSARQSAGDHDRGHRFAEHDAAGARHDFRRSAIEVEPRRDLDRLPESFRPLSDRRLTTRFQGATSAASNARTRLANSSGFKSETSQWAMPRRCQWAR